MGSVFEIALHDVSKMFLGGSPNIPATTVYGIHASHQVACKVEYILFKYNAQYLKKNPLKSRVLKITFTDQILNNNNKPGDLQRPFAVSCLLFCVVCCFPCVSVVSRLSAADLIRGANQCCGIAPPSTSLLPVSMLV